MPPIAPRAAGAGFTVQVTAVRTRQDAEAVVRVLKGRGYSVLLVAPQHAGSSDTLYRVQVGPFASRDRAEKALAKLKHQGFNPFIRH
jgi:cell division septation protein DedD